MGSANKLAANYSDPCMAWGKPVKVYSLLGRAWVDCDAVTLQRRLVCLMPRFLEGQILKKSSRYAHWTYAYSSKGGPALASTYGHMRYQSSQTSHARRLHATPWRPS